ncbi:MAG TPA: DUF305 domain-containing protein [Pilimelia sp.]|nr:DUF305 domain-containing protein [Pilimelia sp.]
MKRLLVALIATLALAGCGTAGPDQGAPPGTSAGPDATAASATPGASPAASAPVAEPTPAAPAGTVDPGKVYNDADVLFLQMMIAQDGQAAEMLQLVPSRAARAELKTMAAAIASTQAHDVTVMRGWLRQWGQPTSVGKNAHASHGDLHATRPEDIAALRPLSGKEFETRFLSTLIGHQHNAIDMARTEVKDGLNPQVKALAKRFDNARTDQIALLLRMME